MRYTKLIAFIILLLFTSSCKVNQKIDGEKVGRWVYKNTVEGIEEVHRGRYRKDGFQKGTWRYKKNGKLYKKEVFRDSLAEVTYYYPNRKIESLGQIVFTKREKGLHYYYTGVWFVYNRKGDLIEVKHYKEGVLEHYTLVRK
ncbi:hypothetical protein LNQ81_07115 [Myroides sp. M-43]|uniref:hypothetical protein n=1 Tax=Myroides oncorhynchi TaxID=2893756 RepID=UPI001E560834|nr:hypothetical protein [Myroides oncorhynchi]MCC9042462.1 hypothetical protein [Myroides oncorhynchi]